jgi:hypothetical protein
MGGTEGVGGDRGYRQFAPLAGGTRHLDHCPVPKRLADNRPESGAGTAVKSRLPSGDADCAGISLPPRRNYAVEFTRPAE